MCTERQSRLLIRPPLGSNGLDPARERACRPAIDAREGHLAQRVWHLAGGQRGNGCAPPVCHTKTGLGSCGSVDIELVALRVLHPDRVPRESGIHVGTKLTSAIPRMRPCTTSP